VALSDTNPCVHGCPPGPECAHGHVAAVLPIGLGGSKSKRVCPVHGGTYASLSVNPGNQGMRTIWKCHGNNCDPADIRAELLRLGIDPTCLGTYGDPERQRDVRPGMRVHGSSDDMVADAKRWHAVRKLPVTLNAKLFAMCIQAIAEGDGDLPGDPVYLLPFNQDDFVGLADRAGVDRNYRYKLYKAWLRSDGEP
jgi:hypothetical protein